MHSCSHSVPGILLCCRRDNRQFSLVCHQGIPRANSYRLCLAALLDVLTNSSYLPVCCGRPVGERVGCSQGLPDLIFNPNPSNAQLHLRFSDGKTNVDFNQTVVSLFLRSVHQFLSKVFKREQNVLRPLPHLVVGFPNGPCFVLTASWMSHVVPVARWQPMAHFHHLLEE